MTELFSAILKASFQGSIVILAVIALRFLLKKAPKSLFCLLWLLAGLRLVMLFEIPSPLSLQPRLEDTNLSIQAQQPVQVPDIVIQNPAGQPAGGNAVFFDKHFFDFSRIDSIHAFLQIIEPRGTFGDRLP